MSKVERIDALWVTGDGREILVSNMDINHIRNALNRLEVRSYPRSKRDNFFIMIFKNELEFRSQQVNNESSVWDEIHKHEEYADKLRIKISNAQSQIKSHTRIEAESRQELREVLNKIEFLEGKLV